MHDERTGIHRAPGLHLDLPSRGLELFGVTQRGLNGEDSAPTSPVAAENHGLDASDNANFYVDQVEAQSSFEKPTQPWKFAHNDEPQSTATIKELLGRQPTATWYPPDIVWKDSIDLENLGMYDWENMRIPYIPKETAEEETWRREGLLCILEAVGKGYKRGLDSDQMFALASSTLGDLNHFVAFSNWEWTVWTDANWEPLSKVDPDPELIAHMAPKGPITSGHTPFASNKQKDFLTESWGRRFYVGWIGWGEDKPRAGGHWGAFIWDKKIGNLYIFNSGGGDAAASQNAGFLSLWQQELYENDILDEFTVIVVEPTRQSGAWECGWLSLTWISQTIRGQIGVTVSELKLAKERDASTPSSSYSDARPGASDELPIRDWLIEPFERFGEEMVSYNDLYALAIHRVVKDLLDTVSIHLGIVSHKDIKGWMSEIFQIDNTQIRDIQASKDGLVHQRRHSSAVGGFMSGVQPRWKYLHWIQPSRRKFPPELMRKARKGKGNRTLPWSVLSSPTALQYPEIEDPPDDTDSLSPTSADNLASSG